MLKVLPFGWPWLCRVLGHYWTFDGYTTRCFRCGLWMQPEPNALSQDRERVELSVAAMEAASRTPNAERGERDADLEALVESGKPLGLFTEERAQEFLNVTVARGAVIDALASLCREARDERDALRATLAAQEAEV